MDSVLIIAGLLFMALPGFLLVKLKAIPKEHISSIAKTILYSSQPFLMVSIFNNATFDKADGINIVIILGVSLLFYALFTLLLPYAFKFLKKPETGRTLSFGSIYGNVGFMGIPVVKALFPTDTKVLVYTAFIVFIFNIASFIFGIFAITGDKKRINPIELLLNPVMIGVYIGALLFFTGWKLPNFLGKSVDMLGDVCIPLSMIMLGMRFATASIKCILKNIGIHIATLLKLVVFPLLIYGVLCIFKNIDQTVKAVLVITTAMPTAVVTLMFAEVYNQDSEIASGLMIETSLFSVLTIPLVLLLF